MQRRVTIVDVARAAGVSASTASRVLNARGGDIRISDATRESVLQAAQRLGYRPNPFAAALRTQRTGVIGVIVRDLCDPFLNLLGRAVQQAARAQGVDLLFAHAEYDLAVVGQHIAFMHSHWFDGLLLLGDLPGDQTIVATLRQANTPFVAVACGQEAAGPMVNVDEAAGVALALDHLWGLGHRRIAFLGNLEHGGVHERLQLFARYCAEHGLAPRDDWLRTCANSRGAALEAAQHLLSLAQPPSAILCATDLAALGAMSGVQRLGLRVPGSVSIIGFDDIAGAADACPALTTICQPVGELAAQAVTLLLGLIDGTATSDAARRVLLRPTLVVRESCAAPGEG
ncbi:MAG TPA: LacI family DNA-binding transcriptional regulator [Anaerolineae bacterium]|nr:LacI family DNA-binding transcriptional regulator [Anaerolineae bacterium]HPL28164.1 LacI family DNA-binding transcriptional regulator [Anaerolineae bacterium]